MGCARRLRRTARASTRGVLRRFDLRYHQARELIRQGEIGEPQAAVHYASTNLLHGHIHSIDTLSFLLDDPNVESIWGELNSIDHRIPANRLDEDPYGIFQLTFANGLPRRACRGQLGVRGDRRRRQRAHVQQW